MNTLHIIFLCYALSHCHMTCTMELASFLTQNKNKTIEAVQIKKISQFSFENIKSCFQKSYIVQSSISLM
jgi:hypothetical protein